MAAYTGGGGSSEVPAAEYVITVDDDSWFCAAGDQNTDGKCNVDCPCSLVIPVESEYSVYLECLPCFL